MSQAFVETVRIERFGCVQDATIELTRLHALIGPNDSGKTTVLAAIHTVGELPQRLDPRGADGAKITIRWEDNEVAYRRDGEWRVNVKDREAPGSDHAEWLSSVAQPARGATRIRWDLDAIRRPCALIPEDRSLTVGAQGDGVAAIYEAILSRDRAVFDEIEAGVRTHFPAVKGIWLPTTSDARTALGVTLNDGTRVHADVMSEGLLYWLALAVLPHVDSTAILLIEEPEKGLHPSRIADVIKALRVTSRRRQILLATHSPLVINELQPDEVTILTRDPKTGTRATRMDRTTHFQQRQTVYALGELWLSFADGDTERALVPDESNQSAG